jgi:hypothetical protein
LQSSPVSTQNPSKFCSGYSIFFSRRFFPFTIRCNCCCFGPSKRLRNVIKFRMGFCLENLAILTFLVVVAVSEKESWIMPRSCEKTLLVSLYCWNLHHCYEILNGDLNKKNYLVDQSSNISNLTEESNRWWLNGSGMSDMMFRSSQILLENCKETRSTLKVHSIKNHLIFRNIWTNLVWLTQFWHD